MYDFGGDWAQQVADASSDPAYMTCTIELRNGATVLLAETRARIIGVRSQTDVNGQQTGNSTGSKPIRVQFPFEAYASRVPRGTQVRVVDGGRNPAIEGYLIVVDADNMSGARGSHTLECSMDVESVATWA